MNDKIYVYMKKGEDMELVNFLLDRASLGRDSHYELYTDSNRDYIAFNQLKRDIKKEKGILIISSINNIGSNKKEVLDKLIWVNYSAIK